MNEYGMLIGSMLAMLGASLLFLLLGHSLIAFVLFVFAVTPLPFRATRWLAGRMRTVPALARRRDAR